MSSGAGAGVELDLEFLLERESSRVKNFTGSATLPNMASTYSENGPGMVKNLDI